MIRTQIQLTEEQHRHLKRWAALRGISLAEAVRRCVADKLAEESGRESRESLVREARALYGRYSDPSGASDVGRDHDHHLADVYRASDG